MLESNSFCFFCSSVHSFGGLVVFRFFGTPSTLPSSIASCCIIGSLVCMAALLVKTVAKLSRIALLLLTLLNPSKHDPFLSQYQLCLLCTKTHGRFFSLGSVGPGRWTDELQFGNHSHDALLNEPSAAGTVLRVRFSLLASILVC